MHSSRVGESFNATVNPFDKELSEMMKEKHEENFRKDFPHSINSRSCIYS